MQVSNPATFYGFYKSNSQADTNKFNPMCLFHANVPKKNPHDMAFDFTKKLNKGKRRNISTLAQI